MVNELARFKFPHLLPGEVRVWRKFLKVHQDRFDRFEYDVHVGIGSLPEAPRGDKFAEGFRWLTRKRIDVIGYKGEAVTLFEIRPAGSLPLIGQIVGYRFLWMRQNPEAIPPALVLVVESLSPDDQAVASDQGVDFVIVPEDEDV